MGQAEDRGDGSEGGRGPTDEVEILPAERGRFRGRRGRVFDAEGHLDRDAVRGEGGERGPGGGVPPTGPGCSFAIGGWFGRLLVAALLLAIGVGLMHAFGRPLAETAAWMRASGLRGRLLVVLVVAAITPVFLPAGPVAILPGYLWGEIEGTGLVLAGAALGGLLNMAISRRLLGRRLAGWAERNPVVGSFKQTIDRRGMRIALALRLSPVMPYSLLAYLVGLSSLPWRGWLLASVVGGIPWTLVYATAGATLAASGEDAALGEAAAVPGALRWAGLAFTLAIALWVGQAARRDLRRIRAEVARQAGGELR